LSTGDSMKILKFSVFMLNLTLVVVLSTFVYRVNTLSGAFVPDFDLPRDTILYSVYPLDLNAPGWSYSETINVVNRLEARLFLILNETDELLLVYDDIDNPGLGVHSSTFSNNQGNYLRMVSEMLNGTDGAVVRNGSIYARNKLVGDSFLSMNNRFVIRDYFNPVEVELNDKEYVYSYFHNPRYFGYFYISAGNRDVLYTTFYEKIVPLYEHYGITPLVEHNFSDPGILRLILSDGHFLFTMIIVFFLFLTLYSFYYVGTAYIRKTLRIHLSIGADYGTLTRFIFLRFSKYIILSTLIGSVLSAVSFGKLLDYPDEFFQASVVSFILNVILSCSLLTWSIYSRSKSIVSKGGRFE
jgi:hypothetical protein